MESGEQISKSGEAPFVDLHPIPGKQGQFKGRDLPASGESDGLESKYKRCKQCGFIVNTHREARGSGYGNEQAVLKTGETDIYDDVLVTGGCPLCGSSEY